MHLKELDANLIVVLDALLIDASVTKAAERLGRSPSAISHALANLRHIFSDDLFVRAGQRLTPTARAKELAPTIHIIVSGLESLLRPTAPFNPGTQERTFKIDGPALAQLYLLQPLRNEIATEAPNIVFNHSVNTDGQTLDELRQGRCDFAIKEGSQDQSVNDITWQCIKEEPFVTYIEENSQWAGKKITKKVQQSLDHIISQPGDQNPSIVEAALEKMGFNNSNLKPISSSLTGLLLAIETGALITIPKHHAQTICHHMPIKEVTLVQPLPKLNIYLGWHRSCERDECHQWLRQKIIDFFSEA